MSEYHLTKRGRLVLKVLQYVGGTLFFTVTFALFYITIWVLAVKD